MSELPRTAPQAALVTASTRCVLVQGLEPLHSVPISELSSLVTVEAAGCELNGCSFGALPRTAAAKSPVTVLMPCDVENKVGPKLTPGNPPTSARPATTAARPDTSG